MLGHKQPFTRPQHMRKRGIACLTRRLFKAGAAAHLNLFYAQGHAQRHADLATMLRPGVSRRLQTVMDMNGMNRREWLAL
ncbi:hypothetical protein PS3A_47150 [Pseudomonas sp. 3A(2025)]